MSSRSESMRNYFIQATEFFNRFRWVYDFKATEILCDEVMRKIPIEFQKMFMNLDDADPQFHEILSLNCNELWPEHMQEFVTTCAQLRSIVENLNVEGSISPISFPSLDSDTYNDAKQQPKKWSRKKYSEVTSFGNFVGQLCVREKCDAVTDIGCGCGYLSGHLARGFSIPVIGIESEPSRVKTAQTMFASRADETISEKYVCLRITENMSHEIGPHLSGYDQICLTALHACGNLTPWSLKHFVSTDSTKLIAIVPCCYHKMTIEAENFPMSTCLRKTVCMFEDANFLKNQWLWRLASQRCGENFLTDIKKETKMLFYRAILETYLKSEKLCLKRRKRKMHDNSYESFEIYLQKSIGLDGGFDVLKHGEKIDDKDLADAAQNLIRLQVQFNSHSRIVTGILALQGAIQSIAEDIILLDRLRFMDECDGIKTAGIVRVIPSNITPRGMVLYGVKK